MPVPVSTIAFAVATCIPFGLAIRDTLATNSVDPWDRAYERPEADEDDEAAARVYENQRAGRGLLEQQRREQELEEAEAARYDRLDAELVGSEPATLGTLFKGIRIGTPDSQLDAIRDRLLTVKLSYDLEVTPIIERAHVASFYLAPHSGDRSAFCSDIGRRLRDTWGEGRHVDERRVWIDAGATQRAVLAPGCELRFEKLAPVASWLARTPESIIPLWAIGQPAAKLADTLDNPSLSAFELSWSATGVGAGAGETKITAELRHGKIVSLFVTAKADVVTQEQIIQRVTELVGKEPAGDTLVWKSDPAFEIVQNGSHMYVTIGNRPQD